MEEITADQFSVLEELHNDCVVLVEETNGATQSEVRLEKWGSEYLLKIVCKGKNAEQFFRSGDEAAILAKCHNYVATMKEKGNPFLDNGMSKAELKELAAQLAKPEGANGIEVAVMMNNTNISMTRKTFEHLDLKDDDVILELGHGNGNHLKELLSLAQNLRYIGLDISELMKEEALTYSLAQGLDSQSEFKLYDGVFVPLASESVDRIFTVNTIYFWTEAEVLLSELLRVLKPNGSLHITFVKAETMNNMPFTEFGFKKYSEESFQALAQKSSASKIALSHYTEFIKTKSFGNIERKFIVANLSKN